MELAGYDGGDVKDYYNTCLEYYFNNGPEGKIVDKLNSIIIKQGQTTQELNLNNIFNISSSTGTTGKYILKTTELKKILGTVKLDDTVLSTLKEYTQKWQDLYTTNKGLFSNSNGTQTQKDKTKYIETYIKLLAIYHFLKIMIVICIYVKMAVSVNTNDAKEASETLADILKQIGPSSNAQSLTEQVEKVKEYIDNLHQLLGISVDTLAKFSTNSIDVIGDGSSSM